MKKCKCCREPFDMGEGDLCPPCKEYHLKKSNFYDRYNR